MFKFYRQISKVLIITLLTMMMPINIIKAYGIGRNEKEVNTKVENNESTKKLSKDAEIIREIEEKREENTKYFLKDDGSFEAVVYKEPVHYLKNNKWEDIDNSFQDKGNYYENKVNEFNVKIAKNTKSQKLVTVEKDKYKISWKLSKSSKEKKQEINKSEEKLSDKEVTQKDQNKESEKPKEIKDNDISKEEKDNNQKESKDNNSKEKELLEENEDYNLSSAGIENINKDDVINEMIEALEKDRKIDNYSVEDKSKLQKNLSAKFLESIRSKVEFKNIQKNIDLEYILVGKTLKENIIINDKVTNPRISFEFNVENLVPKVEDNIIIFEDKNTKEKVFNVDKPFMYDSNGVASDEVELKFTETNKGKYILEIIPSNNWINDKERKFPIIVDPIIRTKVDTNNIQDTFIASNDTENKWNNLFLRVGNVQTIGTTETYVKFINLPSLGSGDMVVNAELALSKQSGYSGADGQINAYTITSDWNHKTITWNSKPQVEGRILDTENVSGSWYSWNITKAAKSWYTYGNNYGIALKRDNPSSGNTTFLSSDTSTDYSNGWPLVSIQYINNTGLESYWTYHSQDMGRAGVGYTNDYNGNVILKHTDYISKDEKLPVKIEHIYNSNNKSSNIDYGMGWKINLYQRIFERVIDGKTYYQYIDGDGTNHYFYYDQASSSYKSETVEGMKLIKNSDSSYEIIDKEKNKLYFVPGGYLKTITDSNENKITILYGGIKITGIEDSLGRVTLLKYNAEGLLNTIVDPAGRETKYNYSGTQLQSIIYPDGKTSYYTYDGSNTLITIQSPDNTKMQYSYYTAPLSRVKSISYSGNGTQGQSLTYKYGYNETEITDTKGITNVYQFNNWGNTVSIKDTDGSAEYYKYNLNNESRNRLELSSKVQKISNNYLSNPSFEKLNSQWVFDYYRESSATGEYSTEEANIGKYSLKINKTNTIASHFYNQIVNLVKGKTYTFSAYVKTSNITKVNSKGAFLFVNYQDKNGDYFHIQSDYVTGTSEWVKQSVTFTLPSDSVSNSVYIRFGIREETGIAYFDNVQLEDGLVPNRYNLVENSEIGVGNVNTEGWFYNGGDVGTPMIYDNRTTYRVKGKKGSNRYLTNKVSTSGKSGDVFVLSGWAKAQALPKKPGRYFALDIAFFFYDGTAQWEVVEFNEGSEGWQYASGEIVAKGDYKAVEVYCLYYDNENYAYFDNVQLYKEEFGQSYQYDSKGNIISTKDLAKQQSNFKYDGEDKLTNVTDPKGNVTKYEYDNKRNLTKVTTAENVISSFAYDKYGNGVTSKIGGSGLFIESSSIANDSGSHKERIIDANGDEVKNIYNSSKDNLEVTINPQGVSTYYSYDEMDTLINTAAYKQYKNIKTGETFLVNGNSSGDLGSKPIRDSNNFIKDGSGHYTFRAENGKGLLYNFGLSKNKGTISMKFKPYGSGEIRYLFHTEGTNGSLLTLYINASDKLCLAIRDTPTSWKEIIASDKTVTPNISYSATVQWENTTSGFKGTLLLDDEVKTNTFVGDFLDFSGGFTMVGESQYNKDALNGEIEELRCSPYLEDLTKLKSHYNKIKSNIYENYEIWDEYFPLRGNSSGINGTKAIFDKGEYNFGADLSMHPTMGRYVVYNTGIRNDLGTFNAWFQTSKSTGQKYIFAGANKNGGLITAYIGEDNKVKLAVKDTNTTWKEILVYDTPITLNQWNMLSVTWSKSGSSTIFNMYVNNNKQSKSIDSYLDFSGSNILVGQHEKGNSLEGGMDELILSSSAYTDKEISEIYSKGRGKAVDKLGNNSYSYANDRLSKVSSDSTSYNFTYDALGNQKTVAVGTNTLITNDYDNITGLLKSSTYGNGNTVSYVYDNLNRVTKKTLDNKSSVNYTYDNVGNLGMVEDLRSGITERYTYDLSDRLIKTQDSKGNWFKYDYDKTNKTSKKENFIGGKLYSTAFEFDKDGKTTKVVLPSGKGLQYTYDTLGRNLSKTLSLDNSKSFIVSYGYKEGYAGSGTTMISSIKNGNSEIKYTYDSMGRIETVNNGKTIKYYYDNLGQVIREDNGELNKTIVYTYDKAGNILKVTEYDLTSTTTLGTALKTINYAYGDNNWKDKLTSYNGKNITYDTIGNPLTYDGYTFTWEGGRTLNSISGNGKNISYKYNIDGIRTEKTVNGVNYKYTLEGNNVVYEEITNGSTVDKLVYNYGDSGLVGFTLNGTEYFYIRNAQGDIIGILDSNGTEVVKYTYDTWGKLISIDGTLKDTVGVKNPYRYRGYRYDTEIGLYYLQSRYYNPELGRFTNADGIIGKKGELLSHNLFAYCMNNPVNMKDEDGFRPSLAYYGEEVITVIVVIVAAVWVTPKIVSTLIKNTIKSIISNSSSNKKSRSKPKQKGKANSREVIRDKNGDVEKYTEFGPDGKFSKEVRLKGEQEHGEMARPNTKTPKYNTNPATGQTYQNGYEVRPSTPEEINMEWDVK